MINFSLYHLFIGIGILIIFFPIMWRRKRTISALLIFSLFWFYLITVAAVVIFPIVPDPDFNLVHYLQNINIIPFYFGNCEIIIFCLRGIIDNIFLTIPFGFGVNFLWQVKQRNIFWVAVAIGIGLEMIQFIVGLVWKSEFRVIDINDAILNCSGVVIGYVLFKVFTFVYLKLINHISINHKGIFKEIDDIISYNK